MSLMVPNSWMYCLDATADAFTDKWRNYPQQACGKFMLLALYEIEDGVTKITYTPKDKVP